MSSKGVQSSGIDKATAYKDFLDSSMLSTFWQQEHTWGVMIRCPQPSGHIPVNH